MTPAALRRAAKQEGVPIIDEGSRQVVEAIHGTTLERRLSRRSRAQRAERRAFEDGQALVHGRGRSMTEPALLGVLHADAARRAEIEAMEHILDAGATEHRVLPARIPRGRHEAARLAERRALDDILRPRPASPPERSL